MITVTEVHTGIVSCITYHNAATGYSVLYVQPFYSPQQQESVTVHETKVFAGAPHGVLCCLDCQSASNIFYFQHQLYSCNIL